MRKADFQATPQGLYLIYWKGGGSSLAAVGQRNNGDNWLAPCNWITPDLSNDFDGYGRSLWSQILRMEQVR
jgi:hypothetical protein